MSNCSKLCPTLFSRGGEQISGRTSPSLHPPDDGPALAAHLPVEKTSVVLRKVKSNESTFHLGDFNAKDAGVWEGVIGTFITLYILLVGYRPNQGWILEFRGPSRTLRNGSQNIATAKGRCGTRWIK